MCGICGMLTKDQRSKPERSHLEKMAKVLRHRGPDEENLHIAEGIGLGHERLSVIDLVSGSQPMCDETGRYWIVFNGEIYNFQEIREVLKSKGYPFRTHSDTEVILQLYREKGSYCVEDLRGMFAFAIWDSAEKQLFMARDRVGKKPLFYSHWNHQLIFASEIKAILQVPGFPREVNPASVNSFFAYTYIPYPATAFLHINELPPAHILTWKHGKISIESYWKPSFQDKVTYGIDEASERLWSKLEEAVRLRMISDVPLGVFLSGGIDSSTVVALMSGLSSKPVKSFSIGFEESDYNELPYARQVAELYGTDHEEFIVRPNAVEILPKIVWHYDQPFSDSSALPSFYVSQMARQRVTVILNGDGGDESFCGYLRYYALRMWQGLLSVPMPIRKAAASLSSLFHKSDHPKHLFSRIQRFLECIPVKDVEESYLRYMIQFMVQDRERLLNDDWLKKTNQHHPEDFVLNLYRSVKYKDPIDRFQHMEILSYLPCDLLVKMDRATMAYGLEGRSPFLDHKIIEFAASLPRDYKMRYGKLKYLLKRMMKKRLPASILERPKWGFGIPASKWFRGKLKDFAREILFDPVSLGRPHLREGAIQNLWDQHQQNRGEHGHRLWSLLVFELWYRNFIDQHPSGPLTLSV